MENNPAIEALSTALQNMSMADAHDIYDKLHQLITTGSSIVNEGVSVRSATGRLLHPSLPAIYDLAWQFIRQYNALGLPTSSELLGTTKKTANIINLRTS